MEEIIKEYPNGEVVVIWKPNFCIHSKKCFHGLPEVFNPAQKPWINIEAASTDQIINQVNQCPSGALSWKYVNTSYYGTSIL